MIPALAELESEASQISVGLLRRGEQFEYYRIMEMKKTVVCLAALAQETRLAIFRLLVQAGPEGVCAGDIGARLGVPPATLSFHLAQLANAGLVQARQQSRFIFYSADFEAMNGIVGFLTENCCGGKPCPPTKSKRKKSLTA